MKNPAINIEKLLNYKKVIIINDDARLNKLIFEKIIIKFNARHPNSEVLYFSFNQYVAIGLNPMQAWKAIIEKVNEENYKNKMVVLLVDGVEYLNKKHFNFNFEENVFFYGIASSFLFWENKNLFFQLTPKFFVDHETNLKYLSAAEKWVSFNQFLYHYCFNLYEANNLVKIQADWTFYVENLITNKIDYINHKKISNDLLRKIIAEIATSSLGEFKMGEFCEKNDLRYESVILGLNYLLEIKFIFEVKFMLNNELYSRKKQSLYFFKYPFIYFYYRHFFNQTTLVENILIAQVIKDYWKFNQYSNLSLSYKYEDKTASIINIKLGWFDLKVDLKQTNFNQVIFNNDITQKLYNIIYEDFVLPDIDKKRFFAQKKVNIKSQEKNDQSPNINLFNYLCMF